MPPRTLTLQPIELELLLAVLIDRRTDMQDELEDLRRRRSDRMAYDPNAAGPFTLSLIEEIERTAGHIARLDYLIERIHGGI